MLTRKKLPVLVEFWAPWCMPCKSMAPLIQAAGEKHKDRVEVWKINADQNPELLRALGIRGIPTMLGYRQGEEVLRKTGAVTAGTLDKLFSALAEGKEVPSGPEPIARALRIVVALSLGVLGFTQGPSYWLLALGALVLIWAFYDRLAAIKALKPLLARSRSQNKD